jgi:hypothetical protein
VSCGSWQPSHILRRRRPLRLCLANPEGRSSPSPILVCGCVHSREDSIASHAAGRRIASRQPITLGLPPNCGNSRCASSARPQLAPPRVAESHQLLAARIRQPRRICRNLLHQVV